MKLEEMKKAFDELKKEGYDEYDILGTFYEKFVNGEIDINQFEAVASLLGMSLTDEFKNLSEEEQKKFAVIEEEDEDDDEEDEE